jgi:hypothetical protein
MSTQLETKSGHTFDLVVNDKQAATELVAWLVNGAAKNVDRLTVDELREVADAAYVAATALGPEAQSEAYSAVMAVTA